MKHYFLLNMKIAFDKSNLYVFGMQTQVITFWTIEKELDCICLTNRIQNKVQGFLLKSKTCFGRVI